MAGLTASAAPLAAQEVIELPGEDRLLDADFEEIYRLGSVDGGGWDTFGSVEDLGFDGAGNLYILDTQAIRISVVDPEGNLVRQFIGEGEGPGEFGSNFARGLRLVVMRDGRASWRGRCVLRLLCLRNQVRRAGRPRDPDRDPAVPAQACNGPDQERGDRAWAGGL